MRIYSQIHELQHLLKGNMNSFNAFFVQSRFAIQTVVFLLLIILIVGAGIFITFRIWRMANGSFLVRRFFEIWKQEGFHEALKVFFTKIKIILFSRIKNWFPAPEIFKDNYFIEDNSEVILYLCAPQHPLSANYYQPKRFVQPSELTSRKVKVSMIATVWNEGDNVEDWLKSIFAQTRLPDEIIITDAGSTDETVSLLQKFSSQSPVPIQILSAPRANIARGRNIAIENAHFEVIATTDFGCRLHPDWLEKLIIPFELDNKTQVVAGMYLGVDAGGKEVERNAWWSNRSIKNPKEFLPSARSSAFTREVWRMIGGFPEWLTLTGEDTYYALEMKKYASRWAFVPEAIAEWRAPKTCVAYWKKIYNWCVGDGESGVNASQYWKLTLQALFPIAVSIFFFLVIILILVISPASQVWFLLGLSIGIWILLMLILARLLHVPFTRLIDESGALYAKILGFLKGARNRSIIQRKRMELIKGTIFILSGVPIDDTGGGARCTQVALELLRQQYAVIFINRYPKYESVELNLSIKDANLFTYQFDDFDLNKFISSNDWLLKTSFLGALVEMPLPDFVPLIHQLCAYHAIVAYDLLDEWNTALGEKWYTEKAESEVIDASQVLVATVPRLTERLERISHRSVYSLPNAVNTRLFNPDRYYEKPADFPDAEWTAIYIGALWGEWFDWDLLTGLAIRYPEAAIVVVGDYRKQCPNPPQNLHFLGLKLQRALPAYLAHANVAVIPWKVNPITQATSPLKIYEYLAMRKPVVAPAIDPLRGIPGVYLAKDEQDFLDQVGAVRKMPLPQDEITQFIRENNWNARVNHLLEQMKAIQ